MDAARFDRLARSLAAPASRRTVLAGLAGLGLAIPLSPDHALAKRRKKPIKRNAFGCVNVGNFCQHAGQCCSGICQGKQGKKRCRGHDGGVGCPPGGVQDLGCDPDGGTDVHCTTSVGRPNALCGTTTGQAAYCFVSGTCFRCTKDAECQTHCGKRAACLVCAECADEGGTFCTNPDPEGCDIL